MMYISSYFLEAILIFILLFDDKIDILSREEDALSLHDCAVTASLTISFDKTLNILKPLFSSQSKFYSQNGVMCLCFHSVPRFTF
jgi:hypothetical protein